MQFNNFCVSSMKIKSLWFGERCDDPSIYKQIKEEGINLYIQLFRFRYHQIIHEDSYLDYQYHIFRVTLSELMQFTKINKSKRRWKYENLIQLLQLLEEVGVIKNHTIENWSAFDVNKDIDKLIVLEATDIPKTYRKDGEDIPVTKQDIYIPINFKTINYIYDDLKLTSKELCLYLLLLRLSNGGEKKAWAMIKTMAQWLGTGKDQINRMLIKLNGNKLIATYSKKNGEKGIKFEHAVLRSYKVIDNFARVHEDAINKYLKRKGVLEESEPEQSQEESEFNPFDNVDDNAKSDNNDDWGVSPYRSHDVDEFDEVG